MGQFNKVVRYFDLLKQKQFLTILLFLFSAIAICQDLEPRFYANTPKNMNAIGFSYSFLKGNVVADPTLPLADFMSSLLQSRISEGYTFSIATGWKNVFFKMISRCVQGIFYHSISPSIISRFCPKHSTHLPTMKYF